MRAEAAALSVALQQGGPIPLDVLLSCRRGELMALVGPSGSGKTTVLRSIAGLYRPGSGRIVVSDDVWFDTSLGIDVTPQARRVGLVFQDYALFPHLSALDNVRLAMQRTPEPERTQLAREQLSRVHLDGLEARRPDELSGGQRQRVAIARALAREPSVLLLDEPFSAVDRLTRETLKEELAALHRTLAIPILLVTHDLEEAQALADRICVLHAGKTLQIATPDDLRLHPASALVARLMGEHNVLDAVADGKDSVDLAGLRLHTGSAAAVPKDQRVAVLVPPEAIDLATAANGPPNVFDARVEALQGIGELVQVTVALGEGAHLLRFRRSRNELATHALEIGKPVRLRIRAEAVHVMPADKAES